MRPERSLTAERAKAILRIRSETDECKQIKDGYTADQVKRAKNRVRNKLSIAKTLINDLLRYLAVLNTLLESNFLMLQ